MTDLNANKSSIACLLINAICALKKLCYNAARRDVLESKRNEDAKTSKTGSLYGLSRHKRDRDWLHDVAGDDLDRLRRTGHNAENRYKRYRYILVVLPDLANLWRDIDGYCYNEFGRGRRGLATPLLLDGGM